MKKLVKFRHKYTKGIFHYDVIDGYIVVLSRIASTKMDHIKEHGSIDVTFKVEEENYQVMSVDVVYDEAYVQKVYDHFEATGNNYFKDGIEGLCVLRFSK